MGSVRRETRNEGYGLHEWDYVPLGEPRVVAKLIQGRSWLDASYYPKQEPVSQTNSAGVFEFSEPILATYLDLDRLIETCGLTEQQRKIITMLMDGHTLTDIAAILSVTVQSVDVHFRRAVIKITRKNDENWEEHVRWAR